MWTESLFGGRKPVIAMVHLDALPGTALYNEEKGLESICRNAAQDYDNLVAGGIDAVIFCNENDKPYSKSVGPEIVAAMTEIITNVTAGKNKIPFGVDVQWDPMAAIAIAKATGAAFVRGIMCGSFCGDLGLFMPDTEKIIRYRHSIGADNVKLLTNLSPEFSYSLDGRDICLVAQTVIKSSLIDGLCVSGVMAGTAAPFEQLKKIKSAVADTDIPVFANTGVNGQNVSGILEIADGCITATCLKVEQNSKNRIDVTNVRKLMDKLSK